MPEGAEGRGQAHRTHEGRGSRQGGASVPVVKRQFGYQKVRFKGLLKNTAQVPKLFALSKRWMARRTLLAPAGEVRL